MDHNFLANLERLRVFVGAGAQNSQNPMTLARFLDKSYLIPVHERDLRQIHGQEQMMQFPGRSEFSHTFFMSVSPGIRPTMAPVDLVPANRVDILTLAKNTDKVLQGKFFLCRTLAPAFKMTSIMTIVEDPQGHHAVGIAFYNYPCSGAGLVEDLVHQFPVQKILAIQNPWFKSTADGGFTVRCDNPGEVVGMSEAEFEATFPDLKWEGEIPGKWSRGIVQSAPKNILEWKNEGNKFFVDKKFQLAIQSYTKGLELAKVKGPLDPLGRGDQQEVVLEILSNRAAAYLALGCFNKVLEDTQEVLEKNPFHSKAIYRKTQALFGLQRIKEALSFLEETLKDEALAKDKNILGLMKQGNRLANQQNRGEYDILKLLQSGNVVQENFADFTGPVKVADSICGEGSGRGLFATEKILPGQLVMASKAFVLAIPPESTLQNRVEFNMNTDTNLMTNASQRILVAKIAERILIDPELGKSLYDLYAGPDLKKLSETEPQSAAAAPTPTLDLKRIDSICAYNSFRSTPKKGADDFVESDSTSGLWILPSYMNHSCWDSNCIWTTFGDVMFVRAFKQILPGEEILISYISPSDSFKNREQYFKKHGFECQCQLCVLDRDTQSEFGAERIKVLKKFERCVANKNYKSLANLVGQMKTKEVQNPSLRLIPSTAVGFLEFANFQFEKNKVSRCTQDFAKCVELLTKSYEVVESSPLLQIRINALANIIGCLLIMGNVKEAKKWVEILKREFMIFRGTLTTAKFELKDFLGAMETNGIFFH